ncbi:MAG: YebC/PmpR family DNA-binding transcriptional regulator [Steroidobacteraceae bacterium]
MAGHSKWANIQHRKGAQDKRRGKVFTKLVRAISTAARNGGADPAMNARLRLAIDKARAGSLPKDTIDRAIKRAAGDGAEANFEAVRYEGYGPGGVAVMVECLTDNRNRTVAEVRHAFTKYGGNLGADGSVAYLFNEVGVLTYPPGTDEDQLLDRALEAGAEDVIVSEDGTIEVLTSPSECAAVAAAMEAAGHTPADASVVQRAASSAALAGEQAESMLKMLETLEDLDDVQNVYSNAEIPDELLAQR